MEINDLQNRYEVHNGFEHNKRSEEDPQPELIIQGVQGWKDEVLHKVANAFLVHKGKGRNGDPKGRPKGGGDGKGFQGDCWFCGKAGHRKQDCPDYEEWGANNGNGAASIVGGSATPQALTASELRVIGVTAGSTFLYH